MSDHIVRHVVIRGRVQGVGFRDWTRFIARERGIEGWVRNRRSGDVEAVFAGSASAVASMIATCRKGPSSAHVDAIDERAGTAAELQMRGEKTFAVLPTV